MKKYLVCFCFAVAGLGPSANAQTLHWAAFDFPPYFSESQRGKPQGMLVDLMWCISEMEKITFSTTYLPNRRAQKAPLEDDFNFTISIPTFIPNQEKYLLSELPVTEIRLMAYWLGDKPQVGHWEDLFGHSVILLSGYSYLDGRAFLQTHKRKITIAAEVENHIRGVESLMMGRGEYFIGYQGPTAAALDNLAVEHLNRSVIGNFPVHFVLKKSTPEAPRIMQSLIRGNALCNKKIPGLNPVSE